MYGYLKVHPEFFMPEKIKEFYCFAPHLAHPGMEPCAKLDNYLSLSGMILPTIVRDTIGKSVRKTERDYNTYTAPRLPLILKLVPSST